MKFPFLRLFVLAATIVAAVGCSAVSRVAAEKSEVGTDRELALDVVVAKIRYNMLTYHVEEVGYSFDLIEVKVTKGPLQGKGLEISVPVVETNLYKSMVNGVPERERMWKLIYLMEEKLVIHVSEQVVGHYFATKGDPSRLMPSIDAWEIRQIEVAKASEAPKQVESLRGRDLQYGLSFGSAISLEAKTQAEGVAAQHAWIENNLTGARPAPPPKGKSDEVTVSFGQQMVQHDGKLYSIVHLQMADRTLRDVYFDISGYFGK